MNQFLETRISGDISADTRAWWQEQVVEKKPYFRIERIPPIECDIFRPRQTSLDLNSPLSIQYDVRRKDVLERLVTLGLATILDNGNYVRTFNYDLEGKRQYQIPSLADFIGREYWERQKKLDTSNINELQAFLNNELNRCARISSPEVIKRYLENNRKLTYYLAQFFWNELPLNPNRNNKKIILERLAGFLREGGFIRNSIHMPNSNIKWDDLLETVFDTIVTLSNNPERYELEKDNLSKEETTPDDTNVSQSFQSKLKLFRSNNPMVTSFQIWQFIFTFIQNMKKGEKIHLTYNILIKGFSNIIGPITVNDQIEQLEKKGIISVKSVAPYGSVVTKL